MALRSLSLDEALKKQTRQNQSAPQKRVARDLLDDESSGQDKNSQDDVFDELDSYQLLDEEDHIVISELLSQGFLY